MHDRYTLQSPWAPVMAITFEGTYEAGPTPGVPNSPADYRRLGAELAAAIVDTHEGELQKSCRRAVEELQKTH